MATIKLSDGRVVPVIKPHIGDQMEVERQMKAFNPKYGVTEFREDMKLASFNQAFVLFASFNRAGVKTTIQDVLEIDFGTLGEIMQLEPGDNVAESGSEGEQSTDPQPAQTGDAGDEPQLPTGPNSIV